MLARLLKPRDTRRAIDLDPGHIRFEEGPFYTSPRRKHDRVIVAMFPDTDLERLAENVILLNTAAARGEQSAAHKEQLRKSVHVA